MPKVETEDLLKMVSSRYKLVVLASLRTLELSNGKEKLVEALATDRFADIAIKEILEGKISYRIKEKKDAKE